MGGKAREQCSQVRRKEEEEVSQRFLGAGTYSLPGRIEEQRQNQICSDPSSGVHGVATVQAHVTAVITGMPAVYELFVLAKNSMSAAQLKTLMQSTGRAILHAGDAIPSAPMFRGSNDSGASSSNSASPASDSSAATEESLRGVIMDIKYFGEQDLAYTIRRPGERHSSALVWQMTFGSEGSRLKEIERGLRLDEGVIRWSLLKRAYPYGEDVRMTSYKVAERARELARQAGDQQLQE